MKLRIILLLLLVSLPVFVLADVTPSPETHPTTSDRPAFVSLTNIPALDGAGNADKLPDFLNSLYRIAIGAAAILAVLQIIRAGIMYMGGDSVTEKKEAKSLIGMSIGGLILILSPVIVFSIINPDILSLKIGELEKLKDTSFATHSAGGTITGTDSGSANTCGDYVSVAYEATSFVCSTLGTGYEDVAGTCSLCSPATGKKCCGTKIATDLKFGWKAWYIVPGARAGTTESKVYRSTGTFATSALCGASFRGAASTLPEGAVFDNSAGKGMMCTCGGALTIQGANCTPW